MTHLQDWRGRHKPGNLSIQKEHSPMEEVSSLDEDCIAATILFTVAAGPITP